MTEPMEHSLAEPSDESTETAEAVGSLPTSVPSENNADSSALSGQAVRRKRLPYAAAFLLRVGVTAAVLWMLLTFVVGVYVCHTNTS